MLSRNVGHTIQSVLNNTPVFVSASNATSAVTTQGGTVYQAGLIGNQIQASFEDIKDNVSVIGKIIKTASSEEGILFLLTAHGSVYAYDYETASCSPITREIYAPEACGCDGDKAVDIAAGRAHVVILTENGKAYGAGSNMAYQLIPQGQCSYKTAVQLLVTDTLVHDNRCCDTLVGNIKPVECPKPKVCTKPVCVQGEIFSAPIGYYNIDTDDSSGTILINPSGGGSPITISTVHVPVFADLSYVGFTCCGEMNDDGSIPLRGTMNVIVKSMYTIPGTYLGQISTGGSTPTLYNLLVKSKTDLTSFIDIDRASQNIGICGFAGESFCFSLSEFARELKGTSFLTTFFATLAATNGSLAFAGFSGPDEFSFVSTLGITNRCLGIAPESPDEKPLCITLDCCCEVEKCKPLAQPCIRGVFAGGDSSVLVDDCNRLYVFGAFWQVRDNKCLLKKSCIEDLLADTEASISMPASQLNCCVRPQNGNCNCKQCCQKKFDTDVSQMGVNICFPKKGKDCGDCYGDGKKMNVCDFLNKLKECNESEQCSNTCEPCDNYIYLDLCSCACPGELAVGTVSLYNRVSVCRSVSTRPNNTNCTVLKRVIPVTINSVVEVTLNGYCIDGVDVELCEIIDLVFCSSGPTIDMYVDLDNAPLGIAFRDDKCTLAPNKTCSKVVFNAFDNCASTPASSCSSSCYQTGSGCNKVSIPKLPAQTKFILNYGSPLDPLELANIKQLFLQSGYFPCPQFTCPITKVINTYLKGGDRVKVICSPDTNCSPNVRHAVTPDLPTVLRLNRPVIDVAVHNTGIVAITGSGVCPNEVYSIGSNCYGELGIKSNASTTCWVLVDRCIFDCQVYRVFAGPHVTFFVTQSGRVYASGSWKCLVHSNRPTWIESICPKWHVKELAVSANNLIGLGEDGTLFGAGENQLGQLGLCHTQCVKKPVCLIFFNKISHQIYNKITAVKNEHFESYERRDRNDVSHHSDKGCKWTRVGGCKKKKCGPQGCDCDTECAPWNVDREDCPFPCKKSGRGQQSYVQNERLTVKSSRRVY